MIEFLDLASRGKTAWWRYGLCCLVASLLAIVLLTVLSLTLMLLRLLPPSSAAELVQPKNPPIFFLGIAAVFGALLVGLIVAAALVQTKRPSDLTGHWRWRQLFWGFGIWAIIQCVLTLIDFLIAPQGFVVSASTGTARLAAWAMIGLSVQTFAEEFIFRGYLTQGILLAVKKPLPAAIVSGLVFGSLHILNGLPQALNAIFFGVVCSLIAIRTGGIALTYGLHLANNYFGAVVVVSTSDVFKGSPGFITQNTPQLLWWDVCLGMLALFGMLWLVLKGPFSILPKGLAK